MSKQSEAKERQGYIQKANQRVCSTCLNYRSALDYPEWLKSPKYDSVRKPENKVEVNIHCGLGGFAVKKMALCNEWEEKP